MEIVDVVVKRKHLAANFCVDELRAGVDRTQLEQEQARMSRHVMGDICFDDPGVDETKLMSLIG